jgi:two-component system, OmpR family, KDP operon response regulator KdpE
MMANNPRVLIIDDNVNLARGFAIALGRAGYDVAVAHTADDGLQLAASQQPDAILLDFQMPFVNGVGFLYRLREMRSLREVPVMVITGMSVNEETRKDLQELRATLRFKPLALIDLLEETRALLASRATPYTSGVTAPEVLAVPQEPGVKFS